jgi:hypothetical protein
MEISVIKFSCSLRIYILDIYYTLKCATVLMCNERLYWSPSCLTPNYYHSELKFWYFKVDSALEITTIQQNWTKLLQQNWPKVLRGEKIGRHVRLVSSSWDLNTISLIFCVGRNWTTSAVSDSTSCIAWDAMILWEHQFVELAGKLLSCYAAGRLFAILPWL